MLPVFGGVEEEMMSFDVRPRLLFSGAFVRPTHIFLAECLPARKQG